MVFEMASLHPHDHFYSGRTSGYSSHSVSPEAEKMLKNPNGSPGPESGAIPDGLEVNQGMDFNNAPQPYYPQSQHQPAPYHYHHATSPQTQYTQTTYTNNHTPVGVPPGGEKGDPRDGRICGLRKPTFFLMLVSLFLLCALIAVAGALGAVVAQKNSELAKYVSSAFLPLLLELKLSQSHGSCSRRIIQHIDTLRNSQRRPRPQ